jgi:hypothetical protein
MTGSQPITGMIETACLLSFPEIAPDQTKTRQQQVFGDPTHLTTHLTPARELFAADLVPSLGLLP